jgi:hypothetical protein
MRRSGRLIFPNGMSRNASNQSKDFAENAGSAGFALIACQVPVAFAARRHGGH